MYKRFATIFNHTVWVSVMFATLSMYVYVTYNRIIYVKLLLLHDQKFKFD